jgi:methylthioribulose-1-phosphate dehydratase
MSATAPWKEDHPRALISSLCRHFYTLGWVSGTGGGISIIDRDANTVYVAPSGVEKEKITPENIYELDYESGDVRRYPANHPDSAESKAAAAAAAAPGGAPAAGAMCPRPSACTPLFMAAYRIHNAGAVIHSHSVNAVLATMLFPGESSLKVTELEMIKGIAGHTYYDTLEVPVIENTAEERDLTDSLSAAMRAHPKTCAVLVRNHGVYIWGKNATQAKTHAECYEYIFELIVKMRGLGIKIKGME